MPKCMKQDPDLQLKKVDTMDHHSDNPLHQEQDKHPHQERVDNHQVIHIDQEDQVILH